MTDGTAVSGASAPVREKPDARHFESVSIRRFRGLEHVELEDLGAVNLLIGANGSGKTSVLEAIFLLSGLANAQLILRVQNQRRHIVREFDDLSVMFHDLDIDRPIELSSVAPASAERRILSISAPYAETVGDTIDRNGARATNRQTPVPRVASSSAPDRRRVVLYEAKMAGRSVEEPLSFAFRLAVTEDGQINFDSPAIEWDEIGRQTIVPASFLMAGLGHDSEAVSRVIVEKKKEKLIEIMQKIDPQIRDVSTSGDVTYFDTGLDKMLPITMFGGGIIRAVDMISQCVLGNYKIVLIDEMENGVHHEGIRDLIEAILDLSSYGGIQIFMTAHSLDVLRVLRNVLNEDEFAGLRSAIGCYVLARDRHGKVRSYRYDYEQFEHNVGHDIEIR